MTSVVIKMTSNYFSFPICENERTFLDNPRRAYDESLSKELGTDAGGLEEGSSNIGKVGGLGKCHRWKNLSDLRQVITTNDTIHTYRTLILC